MDFPQPINYVDVQFNEIIDILDIVFLVNLIREY